VCLYVCISCVFVLSMPERFKVVCTMQGAIQVLGFTFTFTALMFYYCERDGVDLMGLKPNR